MGSKTLVVLGASDPEMEVIVALCQSLELDVVWATSGGRPVHPGNAYVADPLSDTSAFDHIVMVECGIPALVAPSGATITLIDHHRPGDPGFGLPPSRFWEASSLGQICKLFGVEPTTELLTVAAADHCLAAAYRGECPGVDPDALMSWRAQSRAAFQGRSVESVLADVDAARARLRAVIGPEGFADLRGESIPELPEAAAREGIAFLSTVRDRDGREKVVLQAASPELVSRFLAGEIVPGLTGFYGDPARGFAGGYLS